MELFFQEKRRLVLSTLWLLFGILASGYSILYSPMEVVSKQLPGIRQKLIQQNEAIKELRTKQEEKVTKDDAGVSSMPTFLTRINLLAKENHVIINTLTPEGKKSPNYKIDFYADYYTFLKFIARLESLNVSLDDMQIHPYATDTKKDNIPIHFISFTITPFKDAEQLPEEATKVILAKVQQKGMRNPFQRFAADPSKSKMEPFIDLTWVHTLGGFGTGPDGQPFAIINNFEYRKGGVLDGRTITEIDRQAGRVIMEKPSDQGTIQKFVLKSRKVIEKPK